MDNDTFYKFMQFETLKSLTVFKNEGQPLEFDEGILPVLQVVGPTLENLILTKFSDIDLVSTWSYSWTMQRTGVVKYFKLIYDLALGRSCPRLRKMALSGVKELRTSPHGIIEGLYSQLVIMELWLDDDTEFESQNALMQLLHSSTYLESLLVKQSDAFQISVLQKVWKVSTQPNTL